MKENIDKVEMVVKVAKQHKIPIIFITNIAPYAIKVAKLTSRFYKYIDAEIDLYSSECPDKTYVSKFELI